jgi:hypothetical protein
MNPCSGLILIEPEGTGGEEEEEGERERETERERDMVRQHRIGYTWVSHKVYRMYCFTAIQYYWNL